MERSEEFAEPVGSAEQKLKNTALISDHRKLLYKAYVQKTIYFY